ncbi:50S ribosomal protein L21 [Candidatus Eisenbacteria bacterium]|uniref:Large ribosomal subunit protein bL21 n=1 Tax=Eiseniibacteriota bacterium TaxID=2212470 RepID=A0ABV6YMQ7_UNCEI
MYAVVDLGGRQIRVSPDEHVRIPRMDAEVGSSVTFDRILAVRTNGDFAVGSPTVEGAKVVGEVIAHGKADKILVFKMKRRKFYRRKRGHRQPFTEVKISEIIT